MVAQAANESIGELVAASDSVLLKHPRVIEKLYLNRRVRMSTADRLVDLAVTATTRDRARPVWRAAMETLNADAPGIFLYALDNVAAVHKRVDNVQFRPDSWAALLRTWRIPTDRLIDRDRVER